VGGKMLEIGNKIYYLKSNGNVITETGDMMGYVVESTFNEDYENYIALKQYEKDKIGCIQFKFGELGRLLEENKANSYKVDVSSEPHKLVFEWIDYDTGKPSDPPKTQDDILEELKKENETLKDRVDTLSTTVEELVLTTLE